MEHYHQIARRLNLGAGQEVQVIGQDFGNKSITLHFQNFHDTPGFPFPVLEISVEISGGFDAGSLLNSAIGPGEAVRFRVTGQTRVTIREIGGVAVQFGFWTDNTDTQLRIPMTSGTLALRANTWTAIPPQQGFSPGYRRFFVLTLDSALATYDLRYADRFGAISQQILNIPPPTALGGQSAIFALPIRHLAEIRTPAITTITASWFEQRNY